MRWLALVAQQKYAIRAPTIASKTTIPTMMKTTTTAVETPSLSDLELLRERPRNDELFDFGAEYVGAALAAGLGAAVACAGK